MNIIIELLKNLLLLCASCLVGAEVVLIPALEGFDIASANGFDEFESISMLFSPLAIAVKGCSLPEIDGAECILFCPVDS